MYSGHFVPARDDSNFCDSQLAVVRYLKGVVIAPGCRLKITAQNRSLEECLISDGFCKNYKKIEA